MVRLPDHLVIRVIPETAFQKIHLLLVETQGGSIRRRMVDERRGRAGCRNKGNRAAIEKNVLKEAFILRILLHKKDGSSLNHLIRLMKLQDNLSIQRSRGPDRQAVPSVWFDGASPVLLFSQKASSANSDMRLGSSACRSKYVIRNGHAAAKNLKERLSGFFQFFTAQPVNIPVLLPFNLGLLLISYGGPIRILTVFDFAKFRQQAQ